MKKTRTQQLLKQSMWVLGLFMFAALYSCSKDDDDNGDLIASFSYDIDTENHLKVVFTNFSQNATTYLWDFGDGETSTEESPTHIFPESATYEVVLTASNADGESATYKQNIQLTDPDVALARLAGEISKTWKLHRVGTSMGVGPDAEGARAWWALSNDGSRSCVYFHEFTFHRDGSFEFDDQGQFWGEAAVFGGDLKEVCFEAIAANMVNSEGNDVSAWLGGTHAYEYVPSTNTITLNGQGAWMGLPQLGTSGESIVPETSKSFTAVIEEHDDYDLMIVSYAYADLYWDFTYASYSDPTLEPEVITEVDDVEDLPKYAPEQFFNTFASEDEEDVQYLFPTQDASDVTITIGVDDPADPDGDKVGEYQRGTSQFADLKFQMDFNIQFDNFTTVSIDVFVPSTNNYEGGLDKSIMIFIADAHTTPSFWESWVQFLVPDDEVVMDEWVTYTFDLDEPSEGSVGTPLTREDLDLVGLTIGGGDHNEDAVFYIRNFIFE